MVSIAVSNMGMTELIFVVPGMKVNGQYYRDVLLSQQMLPAIMPVVGATDLLKSVDNHTTRWLYCVECPQYSTRRRIASNIHRSDAKTGRYGKT